MRLFSCFSVKHHYRVLIICAVLFLARLTASACDADLYIYQTNPWYICSPQYVTVAVDMYNGNGDYVWGSMRWYNQDTGGDPFYTSEEFYSNDYTITTSTNVYANDGATIWVCFFDYNTWCESPRVPYTFHINPTPNLYWEYAYMCGYSGKIQLGSNSSGVTYTLYQQSQDGGYDYEPIGSNSTGYFEIAYNEPAYNYFITGSAGGCSTPFYQLVFDNYSIDAPWATGNLTIAYGATTTLTAAASNNFSNFRWYNSAGSLIFEGSPYTTPSLTQNTTYSLRGINYLPDNTECITNPGSVTVNVTPPPPPPPVCDRDLYVYMSYPAIICSPQQVTLTVEMQNGSGNYNSGQMRWYTQQTGGSPYYSAEIDANDYTISSDAPTNAGYNTTVWVSFYDYYTGCESPRASYTFSFAPTPQISWEYAWQCGSMGKIQLTSNIQGTLYSLYKASDGGSGYDFLQYNNTGYFEIPDFDPNTTYFMTGYSGACGTPYYLISFDVFNTSAPPVTGNTTISSGSSTTLTAGGDSYNYKWYDANGNFLNQYYQYTTPVLTDNVYTYQVRGFSYDEVCVSDPTMVTVTVNLPGSTYTSLYSSSNFTKTIDLTKPVGTVNGSAGTTATGAATYNIPIYAPPGTNELIPSISVTYSSQSGNGLVGYGWNISGLSAISRGGKDMYHNGMVAPVTYTDQDAFLLNGTRLNPISGANGANGTIYATETESFSKIISNGSSSANPDWFQVIGKDGTIMEFGNSTDSRLLTDDGANNVMMWRLNKIIDINGNYILFKYDNGYRDSRIDEIDYTGNLNTSLLPYNTIKFNYSVRTDVVTSYMAGATLTSKHILNSITVKSENNLVKTYQFNYGFDNLYSLLKEVTETGSDGTSLNSTIFLYGNDPANLTIESSSVVAGSAVDIYTGDYNGDGISDIMAANYQYSNFFKFNTSYTIYTRTDQNSEFQPLYTVPLDNTFQIVDSRQIPNGRSIFTSDFDGDGRDDLLITQSHIQNANDGTRRIDAIQINFSKDANYTTTGFPLPQIFDPIYGYSTCSLFGTANYMIPGDFDGDGATDFLTILKTDYGDYFAFYTSPRAGITNGQIAINGGLNAGALSAANNIQPIDFDGDGKMELLVTKGSYTYILSLSTNTSDLWNPYKMDVIYTTSLINSNSKIYPGDFNGDRKTDLLEKDQYGWSIFYSDGKSMFYKNFAFNEYVDNTNDKIIVADFNGDGRADILHGYNYFVGGVASTSKLSTYYSKGDPSLGFYFERTDYNNVLGFTPLVVADLNGDGRNDFINRNFYADPFDILYLKQNGKERLLVKVKDGHNDSTSFNYKTLTDKTSTPYVYNRTVSPGNAPNQYPFNYVQQPMYVVSAVTVPNGIGGTNTVNYTYEDAVVHRAAKGFLGFKKIIADDVTKDITSITENDINTDFAVPYTINQSTQITSTKEVLSQSSTTTSFISLSIGSADPKRFVQHTDKVLSVNNLSDAASEITNTYDDYGNVTTSVSKTGTLSGTTVNAVETVTTTTAFGIYNTPVPARPDNITATKVRSGMSAQSSTTTFTYNSNGTLASQTAFAGLPKAVTSNYNYDGYGNIILATTSSAGLNNRTVSSTYDSKGRFVLTKQTGSAAMSKTESFTFDNKWGKQLSGTTSDCLTTTYEYDGFGNLIKTNLPDNYSITSSLIWDVSGENVFYRYTNIPGGSPSKKVWYDILGRETKKQTAGFNNQWLTQLTTYDAKGNVATKTNNYYSTETALTTTNTYDAYNRLQMATNALKTINYTYTKLGGGKLQVTTQTAGQSSTKISDATGKVVTAIDNGGQVDFTYNSLGLQTQVTHGGIVVISAQYDNYGKQTLVTEKNAGTITYDYDAFGQLKTQTDNNGNTHNMTYDDFGRIITRQGPEGTTTYEYYKDNSTGCSNNNLVKQTDFNGVVKEYTYDNLKRLQTGKVTIDGTAYVTQYGYNSYGNLTTTTYPSGIVINKNYDNNGQLVSVTGGDAGSQTTLFTGTQKNGFGEYTGYTLGNNRSGQNTYNYGMPTRFYTPGIQDLNLNFDFSKGNLTSRQDVIKNITESFQYDDLNRLTQTSVNGQVQINIGYDNNAGHSWGNIMSKTDAGNYVYNIDKIHAVSYITNPAGAQNPPVTISTTDQLISYTPFLKTASIAEGNYQEYFTYDADYERIKTELKQSGNSIEKRYFFGNYEKQITAGSTREIHYISGGNGLCAIIVRENGVNNFYFIYTDHLGSLLTVTDINGNIVAEQNFDAWGRNRNPGTWQYASVPSVPGWLYRGYTGHEHLTQFALINMNGRLYDPVQGRMLSPDNNVSSPFGTQGYNRYAYAMNNPLVYSDPDGQFIQLIVGAVLGGLFNLMQADMNGKIGSFWDGLKYFGVGAAAGALGAGVGSGISASMAGASFGAGFMGTTGASATGFFAGALAGAGGGLAGGFVAGFGNSLVDGNSLGTSLNNGLINGGIGALQGGIIGGVSGGFDAVSKKVDFFTGRAMVDLSQGVGAHNIPASAMNGPVSVKYVGRFEKIAVYESASLGSAGGGTSGGITLPGMGITVGSGVYASSSTDPADWNVLAHEFGHVLQSKLWWVGADGFYKIIGTESLASATFNGSAHNSYWTETWANYLSHNYFKNIPWDFNSFPVQNIGFWNGLKFMLYRDLNPIPVPAYYP